MTTQSPELKSALRARDDALDRLRKVTAERDALMVQRRKLTAEDDEARAGRDRYQKALFGKRVREAAAASIEEQPPDLQQPV